MRFVKNRKISAGMNKIKAEQLWCCANDTR